MFTSAWSETNLHFTWPVKSKVSFGMRDLEWVVDYIRNQKEHHQDGTTVEHLERIYEEAKARRQAR